MNHDAFNVLFLCVDNSARSIMAEALLNRFGGDRFRAFSAGISPAGRIHPVTIELLRAQGLPTDGLRSKSWREFCTPSAPRLHFLISFFDPSLEEVSALVRGDPVTACWHITDPLREDSRNDLEQRNAFRRAFRELENRIRLFVLLRHGTPERWARPSPQITAT